MFDTDTTLILVVLVKYFLECTVVFSAGYFWGKSKGFDFGFRLGNLLTECRLLKNNEEVKDEHETIEKEI